MISEESRLNLAHQNLRSVPKTLINSFQTRVKIIDLSNNNIDDVSFLRSFSSLTCIILDHNDIGSDTVFPYLPNVTIVWLNYNNVHTISEFAKRLASSFPNVQQLSLMGNPGVPHCREETFYDYLRYRLYVISCFNRLQYLDDRPVTDHERQEAVRLFGSPLLEKLSLITDTFVGAVSKLRQYITSPQSHRPNVI
uniref:Leucine-rich melanocyte differentiation-associated protein-like n=1 Tax=Riptortus pedestris TaxID=329032 RepID=R4WDU4_RIPPE|nr:conserved hypothetical protein [Riptortus pedestris]